MPAFRKRSAMWPTICSLADHIQTALGGQLLTAFRHQRRLIRLDVTGDVRDRVDRGHFQVQTIGDDWAQQTHVAVLDVAPVFAQVDGDAVGAGEEGEDGRRDRIGFFGPPRLPHGGDVVDVDAEANHGSRLQLSGFTSQAQRRRQVRGGRAIAPRFVAQHLEQDVRRGTDRRSSGSEPDRSPVSRRTAARSPSVRNAASSSIGNKRPPHDMR